MRIICSTVTNNIYYRIDCFLRNFHSQLQKQIPKFLVQAMYSPLRLMKKINSFRIIFGVKKCSDLFLSQSYNNSDFAFFQGKEVT